MAQAIASGEKQGLRLRVLHADGNERFLQVSVMLVPDTDGSTSRLMGTALDVTADVHADEQRQRIDAQMQQAQTLESLGVLAGCIAHDFNNLLVGILGHASLALLEVDAPRAVRDCVQEIERASQKAAELTRQFLAYAGKGRYIVEPVDASATIQEMGSLLRSAVSRSASLPLALPSTVPLIEVDVNQFRQLVMTLVTNASDALGGRQGVISVLTGRQTVTAEYLAAWVPGSTAVSGSYVIGGRRVRCRRSRSSTLRRVTYRLCCYRRSHPVRHSTVAVSRRRPAPVPPSRRPWPSPASGRAAVSPSDRAACTPPASRTA